MRLSGNSDALLSGLGRYGAILIGCFPERLRGVLIALPPRPLHRGVRVRRRVGIDQRRGMEYCRRHSSKAINVLVIGN